MGMTWAYNPEDRDESRSIATIHRAIDLGVTLIDTADMYGPFTNEELVGKALKDRRDEVTLATKVGIVVNDVETFDMGRDGSPAHVRGGIDDSLRRLGTDHVDLYQLHRTDPEVPVEETWSAMAELVQTGKVGAIGMSEATIDELDRAHAIHPVATLQSEFSLWTREPLEEVIPWCREHDTAFIPFSPLGRGFLTGSLKSSDLPADDFRSKNPRFTEEAMASNQAVLDHVEAVAERLDATPGQVALAWTLAQYDQIVPIPGTRRPERVEENAGAAALELTRADLDELDRAPAAAGARY